MNYCVRCKYYYNNWLCRAITGKRDIVTGEEMTVHTASFARYNEAYCGADGKWFEKMEEEK